VFLKGLQSVLMYPKACAQDCVPPLIPPLRRHCLQNLVQYFKFAYVFSVRVKSFVIVLTSIYSCTCNSAGARSFKAGGQIYK